jgi:quercetin dioxygenase-like cupin family protein
MHPLVRVFASIAFIAGLAAPSAHAQSSLPLVSSANDKSIQWGPCPGFLPKGCQIGVLHGDPAKPNVDIFFKVPGKSKIAAHTHTSAERMVLVSGQLDVTYAGHPTTSLKRGDYAYGPAAVPHTAHCNGVESCTLFIAFNGAVDALPFAGVIAH